MEWRRSRNDQSPSFFTPTIVVSGAFVAGGNSAGVLQDHLNDFELQDYATATAGNHTLRFGIRARGLPRRQLLHRRQQRNLHVQLHRHYRPGSPPSTQPPSSTTRWSRTLVLDGSAFFQDDWRIKPNLMIGLGVRYEDQNWIHDHNNWSPRIALAWSPGRPSSATAKTVFRAGYGWFYDRFTVPTAFSSFGGAPYIVQNIHDNRVNQQSYVVANPTFYNPRPPRRPRPPR